MTPSKRASNMQGDAIGAAAALPTIKPKRAKGATRARLTPALRVALEAMAYKGLSVDKASSLGGLQPESLRAALRKPHVKAMLYQLIKEIREGAAQQAYVRIVNIAEDADSADVKLRANQWVAGVDGIAAVKLVAGKVHHSVSFEGFAYDDPVEGTLGTASDSVSGDGDA